MRTDDAALLEAYDALRPWVEPDPGPDVDQQRVGPLIRVAGREQGFVEGPRDLGLDGPELDALIAEQRRFFAARGESFEWKTRAHDLPADLGARLLAAGFEAEPVETVMIGEAAAVVDAGEAPVGVAIRRATERADLDAVAAMETAVWGEDWSWIADDLVSRTARHPEEHLVFVAQADDLVVAAAWLALKPGTPFAGLWGGSTLTAWRGLGVYRALVAVRARAAIERGATLLQVDASNDSRPVLERLGFRAVTTTTPYVWRPTG